MEILNLKAWEMKEKLLNKEISTRELVEAHLNNIDSDLNAFITIDKEGALSTADLVDKKINAGEELGLLAGLPIGIKDNIVTKDLRTTCGSKMLENYISPYNATVIEKIKAQDGIIIGKTNMDEFAMGSSNKNSYFGKVKNPINKDLVPGGSSGGSAVAVAANEAAISLGSDTGGSIRQPAAFCGVVGLKPTYGLVSRYGLVTVANTMDQIGVFGKDVRDALLMLNVIDGMDKKDPTSVNSPNGSIIIGRDNKTSDPKDLIKGMKIGIPKEILDIEMDNLIRDSYIKSIEMFRENGAEVEEFSLSHFKYTSATYQIISNAELSSNLARFDGLRYGYRAEGYETLDELYIKSRSNAFGDETKRRIILGTYVLSTTNSNEIYIKALKLRNLIKQDFDMAFKRYDIILTPTTPILPYKLETEDNFNSNIFTTGVNLAGNCAISIPMKINDNMLAGIQFIGDRFKEFNIIKAGLALEGMVK